VNLRSFTHLALRVERLRAAEAFYCELFALEVAFREAETPEGWRRLPTQADWADAKAAGVKLNLVMLYRDGFRLALEGVDRVSPPGLLSHVGVYADKSELERLRERAEGTGCQIVTFDRECSLVGHRRPIRRPLGAEHVRL
jgi:hypothetical protein